MQGLTSLIRNFCLLKDSVIIIWIELHTGDSCFKPLNILIVEVSAVQ